MNSGTAAKSAKRSVAYPCTYDDCFEGFSNKAALDKHKYEEHDGWCEICDIDHEDHLALHQHKVDDENHICCKYPDCGKDFHCERAKDTHEFTVSP